MLSYNAIGSLSDNLVNCRMCHSGESRNPVFKPLCNTSGCRVKPGMTVIGQILGFPISQIISKAVMALEN